MGSEQATTVPETDESRMVDGRGIQAWHFLPRNRRLTHGDGREVVEGEWLEVDKPPILRLYGFHACVDILDALSLAGGPIIQRVEMGGEIVRDEELGGLGGLIAATRRKCLWWSDVSQVLGRYNRLCALDVAYMWNAPGIVVRYLRTGDESLLSAARAAMWGIAQEAKQKSAQDATWAATWDAKCGPDWVSTGRAGRAAVQALALAGVPVLTGDSVRMTYSPERVAALASAREGVRAVHRRRLLRLVHAEHGRQEAAR